jgi:uncharacterized Zn finger protein (UPF0148 family)
MKLINCEKCGASDFYEQNGFRICCYCDAKYALRAEDMAPKKSNIALNDDVTLLLQKCRDDPANARRYASLVLDIDPTNKEARKYF